MLGLKLNHVSKSGPSWQTVASFTKEVNPRLAKRPLKINGRLANHELTSLVKEATAVRRRTLISHNLTFITTTQMNHRVSVESIVMSVGFENFVDNSYAILCNIY